jgi:hypothetical protein
MNLSSAALILDENSRYFADVYKNFSFRDDQLLKDYLDFILHEPVEWLKGFPAKLKTKNTFSRPKAALIKLLKTDGVKAEFSEEYVASVYNSVWNAFKKNVDSILEQRNKTHVANVVEQMNESIEGEEINSVDMDIEQEQEQAHAEQEQEQEQEQRHEQAQGHANHCVSCQRLQFKYNISVTVIQALIQDYSHVAPGLANSTAILLSALSLA